MLCGVKSKEQRADMAGNERFSGRVAIVTGAANGIGLNAALAFARERAALVLVDREAQALEAATGACREAGASDVLMAAVDVTVRRHMEAVVERASGILGHVDILVNNAGVLEPSAPLEEIPDETWRWVWSVNVMGVINGCRAVIPIMKRQGAGRIINAASMYGVVPQAHHAPVCVSKAAVITITRALAAELGPYGVTVNAYAPGTIRTRMAGDALTGARAIERLRSVPLGRFGEPEDVVEVILFLASEGAAYVTGAVFAVDGGTLTVQDPTRVRGGLDYLRGPGAAG
jgi:3-oxoacyl-[acyl-carrier protein] reductase